jgi:hypothetical protein
MKMWFSNLKVIPIFEVGKAQYNTKTRSAVPGSPPPCRAQPIFFYCMSIPALSQKII